MDAEIGVGVVGGQRSRYVTGIALLLVVVFLWTASNFVTQDVFDEGFDKPFMVTYLNTASFAVYLIPFVLQRFRSSKGHITNVPEIVVTGEFGDTESLDSLSHHDHHLSASALGLPPLTNRETFELARMFVTIWFLANWTVSAALKYTTVASTTILASTSGFFTLIVGRMFRVETLSFVRVAAVFGSFIGVVMVSRGDYTSEPTSPSSPPPPSSPRIQSTNPLLGDTLALLSALFYGLYVTLLKVRVRSESRIDMRLFFGYVGAISICCAWVVGVVLHATGLETFALPKGSRQWGGILVNMLITLSSDYLYVLAMLKTTPLMVTVGLSLTIPCALIGDALMGHYSPGKVVLGAGLVVGAFVVVGLEDTWGGESGKRERERSRSRSRSRSRGRDESAERLIRDDSPTR